MLCFPAAWKLNDNDDDIRISIKTTIITITTTFILLLLLLLPYSAPVQHIALISRKA